MKNLSVLLLTLFSAYLCTAQQRITESIYSSALKDTITYRVWLPEDWDSNKKHAVIYTVEDSEDGMLAHMIEFYGRYLPPAIVVGIVSGREYIEFDFSTGHLNEGGPEFLACLTDQIMPAVEKKYSPSSFRAFMGHSYSASYANYLFLEKPGLFSGYMLFAPERWWIDEKLPRFELSPSAFAYYNTHKTFFSLVSAEGDIDRRKYFASEIAGTLSRLDSNHFFLSYRHLQESDHITAVPNGMIGALEHIFKPYYYYHEVDSVADPLLFFLDTQKQLQDIYGIELEKNNSNIAIFSSLAATSNDKKAMEAFAAYFLDDKTKGLDLRNFAYSCVEMGMKDMATQLYRKCIEKSRKDEMNTVQGPLNLVMAYRELAYKVHKEDNDAAWLVLNEALGIPGIDPIMHYYVGKLAADRSYRVKEGIRHLQLFNEQHDGKNWGVQKDAVYYYLGKSYLLLKDKPNARKYAEMALSVNPEQSKAKELLQQLNN